jgi:mannose-6-phosphate isomerase
MAIEKPTPKIVKKGWGHEEIWASTPEYCAKLLCFRSGAFSSLHLHRNKTETWRCLSGKFRVTIIDPVTAKPTNREFLPGQVIHLPPMTIHRLSCLTEGTVLEVSTYDDPDDNYRVAPGDSQAVA